MKSIRNDFFFLKKEAGGHGFLAGGIKSCFLIVKSGLDKTAVHIFPPRL